MDRQEKLMTLLDSKGRGLEIGASYSPVFPKSEGFNVETLDCMSKEELIEKYTQHGVDISKIEEVDYIWKGESYAELIGAGRRYDWIFASHTIEHTPDLLGFLNDCSSLLKENGVLVLAVPDKRYCFDEYRSVSALSSVIDAHLCGRKMPSAGAVAEYHLNVISRGGRIAWEAGFSEKIEFIHSTEEARDRMNDVSAHSVYFDVHVWCFVPFSFRLILHDLANLELTDLRESKFTDTEGCEFFVALSRNADGPRESRKELLDGLANSGA